MRDVIGFEGLYQVSKSGHIYSLRGNRWLKPWSTGIGYLQVSLINQGIEKRIKVHRLVALAWIPNPENKPQVNHKNKIKNDNRVENLEWCTRQENQQHYLRSVNDGQLPVKKMRKKEINSNVGVLNNNVKMRSEQIVEIRSLTIPQWEIAKNYGLTQSCVSKIKRRATWSHLV